jgi:diguanylate cyclase (GGDEF)-like protein
MLLNCVKKLIKTDDSYSVLIVDDQETSLTALSNILSPDYTVYEADNGPEAIEIAEKYLPDVILLDVLMTQMDGYAVIEKLKASDDTQAIPIIFITSLGTSKDEEKGLALGAVDYITKPFVPEIVRLRLQNQIKVLEQVRTIERLSTIDQLTNLPNRRSFETRMGTEWGRATREKTPISILMIDIDLFKHYNDTYGHQQGDAALQEAAKVFSQKLKRHGDFAARWGGEEFIILLPNTDEEGAIDVAEQVRQAVERLEIPGLNGMITKINVSIGIYTRMPNQGRSSISEFISRADKALYIAKNNGRNQAQVYKEK